MIVLSGLLVLVSIVLLVLGLADEDSLTLVYFSIGTSIVAGALLVLGALQRRGDAPAVDGAAAGAGADTAERVTTVSVTRPTVTTPVEETAGAAGDPSGGPMVSVVPGRPRYHVAGCRFLAGRDDVTQVSLEEAKGESYSACGVCKPDDALAATVASEPSAVAEDPEVDSLLETPAERARTRAKSTAAATRAGSKPAARATAASGRSAVKAAPAKPATKATAARSTATKATAAKSTATKSTATKATPAKASAAKATAAKPAAKAVKAAPAKATGATVVVIPDRDKFHTDGCRFVRGVAGTVSVGKATAKRQGYEPCGVCKP